MKTRENTRFGRQYRDLLIYVFVIEGFLQALEQAFLPYKQTRIDLQLNSNYC